MASTPRRPRVLFVCVENSCRSQMAEAFARMEGIEAASTGSRPSGVVNPDAIRAMAELGYDLATHRSKPPAALPPGPWEVVVSMGCGDECPAVPARRREDWDVPDPKGRGEGVFRAVRDEIRTRVRALRATLTGPSAPSGDGS